MNNLIKSEFYKLRKDRSFWLVMVCIFAISIAFPIIKIDESGNQATGISIFMEFFQGNIYIIKLVPVFISGFFISSDYSRGVMKSIVSSGNSRSRIYAAKLFVFSVPACLFAIMCPLISGGIGAIIFGGGSLPGVSMLTYVLRTVFLTALYGIAFASIVVLFAMIFTDSGKTIGFLFFFFMSIDQFITFIGNYIPFFTDFYKNSILYQLMNTWKLQLADGELLRLIVIPVLTYVIMGVLGSIIFSKKEIS